MKELLLACSYHDVKTVKTKISTKLPAENIYHVLFFAALKLTFTSQEAIVQSNIESGKGRYDIKVELLKLQKIIIFEFKRSSSETNLDSDADKARKQIIDKNYLVTTAGI
jgi:PD-(D/E)XK nuclease superfamily